MTWGEGGPLMTTLSASGRLLLTVELLLLSEKPFELLATDRANVLLRDGRCRDSVVVRGPPSPHLILVHPLLLDVLRVQPVRHLEVPGPGLCPHLALLGHVSLPPFHLDVPVQVEGERDDVHGRETETTVLALLRGWVVQTTDHALVAIFKGLMVRFENDFERLLFHWVRNDLFCLHLCVLARSDFCRWGLRLFLTGFRSNGRNFCRTSGLI